MKKTLAHILGICMLLTGSQSIATLEQPETPKQTSQSLISPNKLFTYKPTDQQTKIVPNKTTHTHAAWPYIVPIIAFVGSKIILSPDELPQPIITPKPKNFTPKPPEPQKQLNPTSTTYKKMGYGILASVTALVTGMILSPFRKGCTPPSPSTFMGPLAQKTVELGNLSSGISALKPQILWAKNSIQSPTRIKWLTGNYGPLGIKSDGVYVDTYVAVDQPFSPKIESVDFSISVKDKKDDTPEKVVTWAKNTLTLPADCRYAAFSVEPDGAHIGKYVIPRDFFPKNVEFRPSVCEGGELNDYYICLYLDNKHIGTIRRGDIAPGEFFLWTQGKPQHLNTACPLGESLELETDDISKGFNIRVKPSMPKLQKNNDTSWAKNTLDVPADGDYAAFSVKPDGVHIGEYVIPSGFFPKGIEFRKIGERWIDLYLDGEKIGTITRWTEATIIFSSDKAEIRPFNLSCPLGESLEAGFINSRQLGICAKKKQVKE